MSTGFNPVITVEDSILDISSPLVEQVPKRGRRNAEVAVALSQPIGYRPALGAVQRGSRGDPVVVKGDFSPITVRRSGDATTAAALVIMEVESQMEQELADAAAQKAKATQARLALLKAQAEGSQGGGSRRGSRSEARVAPGAQAGAPIPLPPVPQVPDVDRELSEMLDDELDARVDLRQRLDEAALRDHQVKQQSDRDQFLREQMAKEAAEASAAFAQESARRLAVAEKEANAARAADALAASQRQALVEQRFNAARAADALEASQRQAVADERTSLLRTEMAELQQRAEAFAQHESRAREVQLEVLRACEMQTERDRQQFDELRQRDQAHAQQRHEQLLGQQRLVMEHEAAQAYGEAAAAQVRVQQLVAE